MFGKMIPKVCEDFNSEPKNSFSAVFLSGKKRPKNLGREWNKNNKAVPPAVGGRG